MLSTGLCGVRFKMRGGMWGSLEALTVHLYTVSWDDYSFLHTIRPRWGEQRWWVRDLSSAVKLKGFTAKWWWGSMTVENVSGIKYRQTPKYRYLYVSAWDEGIQQYNVENTCSHLHLKRVLINKDIWKASKCLKSTHFALTFISLSISLSLRLTNLSVCVSAVYSNAHTQMIQIPVADHW